MIRSNKFLIILKAFALIVIFVLSACSPEPVLRLEAEDEDKTVIQGMEYLQSDLDESTAILAYYRHINNKVVMDLEVINYANTSVRVNPAKFSYKAYKLKSGVPILTAISSKSRSNKAYILQSGGEKVLIESGTIIDPESEILEIDKQKSRETARETRNLVLDAVASGVSMASEIATIGEEETREERAVRQRLRMDRRIERSKRREAFYERVTSLNEQRNYWETEVIRTTDLIPEKSAAGELIFPAVRDAHIIEIHLPVGGDVHQFRYLQQTYSP
jgi:hypothetical protein